MYYAFVMKGLFRASHAHGQSHLHKWGETKYPRQSRLSYEPLKAASGGLLCDWWSVQAECDGMLAGSASRKNHCANPLLPLLVLVALQPRLMLVCAEGVLSAAVVANENLAA